MPFVVIIVFIERIMGLNANLILEDNVVLGLSAKPDIIVEFPSLRYTSRNPVPARGGCGGCGRRNPMNQDRFAEAQRIKRVILGLPPEKKNRLKQLLNAARITMFIPGPMGVQQHSF